MKQEWEEVLEAIWTAREAGDHSRTGIHRICHVSLTEELLREVEEAGLVEFDEDHIYFTNQGDKFAKKVIRRQRLAEVLIKYALNLNHNAIERLGCEAEHTLIPEMEESICILLGHPTHCPHGRPIPPGECCRKSEEVVSKIVVSL